MKLLCRVLAVFLFAIALGLTCAAFGIVGGHAAGGNPIDSPVTVWRIIGGLLPAAVLITGGVWLWQRYKTA